MEVWSGFVNFFIVLMVTTFPQSIATVFHKIYALSFRLQKLFSAVHLLLSPGRACSFL